MRLAGLVALLACASAACSTGPKIAADIPTGEAAYARFPASSTPTVKEEYKLSPLDKVDVTVFDEPDLSAKGIVLDASGDLNLPLIGSIPAAGKTQSELSRDIQA